MHEPITAPAPLLADPAGITDADARHLRRAIALACLGRARGNRPFGAVIVAGDGTVLAEGHCQAIDTGDCTAHAEINALRRLRPHPGRHVLEQATLYVSAEPCAMCAGAIFWSGIGRVVYGIDAVRLRVFRGERLDQRDAELSCRDVFDASPRAIDCLGPALIAQASASHQGGWTA